MQCLLAYIYTQWNITQPYKGQNCAICRDMMDLKTVKKSEVSQKGTVKKSEVSQKEKNKYHILTHIYGI